MRNARSIIDRSGARIVAAAKGHESQAKAALESLSADLIPVEKALTQEGTSGTGSLQQRSAYDEAFSAQDAAAHQLSVLEALLVPDSFHRCCPHTTVRLSLRTLDLSS